MTTRPAAATLRRRKGAKMVQTLAASAGPIVGSFDDGGSSGFLIRV